MITFCSGKPGGGKTKLAVLELVEEIRRGKRMIVTNMAIRMDPWVDGKGVARSGLERSLQDKFGDTFDCRQRICLIDDDEVKRFYAVRPTIVEGRQVKQVLSEEEDGRFRLKVGAGFEGVAYFIDEAHEFFSAREWAKTGKEVLSWASQQRRAGDDCWFLSQVVNNVEKQLRGVSQQCYWVTNHRLASLGVFRQPDVISYRLFSSTPPAPTEMSLRKGIVRYDKEFVHALYDTAAGVGVTGRGADIGQRAKGLHWSFLPIVLLALGVVFTFGFHGLREGIRKVVGIEARATEVVPSGAGWPAERLNGVGGPTIVTQVIRVVEMVAPAVEVVKVEKVRNVSPWAVTHLTSRNPGESNTLSATVGMSDGTFRYGKLLTRVGGGYLLDGTFISDVPTEGTNRTAYLSVDKPRERR